MCAEGLRSGCSKCMNHIIASRQTWLRCASQRRWNDTAAWVTFSRLKPAWSASSCFYNFSHPACKNTQFWDFVCHTLSFRKFLSSMKQFSLQNRSSWFAQKVSFRPITRRPPILYTVCFWIRNTVVTWLWRHVSLSLRTLTELRSFYDAVICQLLTVCSLLPSEDCCVTMCCRRLLGFDSCGLSVK